MWMIVILWIIVSMVMFFVYVLHDSVGLDSKKWVKALGAIILLVGGLITFRLTSTASFERSIKNIGSEFKQDIYREITVHSRSGDVIYESEGRFDVEHLDGRLKWIDEDGRVQIIYLGESATAIVNEVEETD